MFDFECGFEVKGKFKTVKGAIMNPNPTIEEQELVKRVLERLSNDKQRAGWRYIFIRSPNGSYTISREDMPE